VIERPRWNLTLFKIHFGLLTLKGYTKGEHVLRFEAIVHNTRALRTGRVLEKFPDIVARLAAMVDRFTSACSTASMSFPARRDPRPTPDRLADGRDPGRRHRPEPTPHVRTTVDAVLALAVAPDGFTVTDLAAKVRSLTGQRTSTSTPSGRPPTTYASSAANTSSSNPTGPAATRLPGPAARTLAALLTLRDRIIAPILAGVRRPGPGRPPTTTPASTATTTTSATTCATSSTTSPSTQRRDNNLSMLLRKPLTSALRAEVPDTARDNAKVPVS